MRFKNEEKTIIKEELAKRNLPDLFRMPNGQKINTKEEWENIARPYWKDIILQEEFTCVNDSGTSCAALSRGLCQGGESIRAIVERFPFWFCPNYFKYIDKADELPFDQHCLTALVAPRQVSIGGAIEDIWADNDNQYLNCVASSPVWKLYGKTGVITENKMPVCGDIYTDGEVGFHL